MKILFAMMLCSVAAWAIKPVDPEAPPPIKIEGRSGVEEVKVETDRPRPPREALEACQGKKRNAECAFNGRKGEKVVGYCWAPSPELPLACRPEQAIK